MQTAGITTHFPEGRASQNALSSERQVIAKVTTSMSANRIQEAQDIYKH